MNSILGFAYQGSKIVSGGFENLGSLYDYCQSNRHAGFLYYEPGLKLTRYVFPPVAVNELRLLLEVLPRETPLIESGILDVLGSNQASVEADRPAVEVATIARTMGARYITVNDRGEPRGVFFPEFVQSRLPHVDDLQKIGEQLSSLAQSGQLIDMITTVDEVVPSNFSSEILTKILAEIIWCYEGHQVEDCPCHEHPRAECRQVAL